MSHKAIPVGTPTGMVALLFTDLVGSTELLDRLGDDAAEELRRIHFSLLRRAVAEAGGVEVKSLGDGLMVSFVSSVQAVRCAVAVQRAIDEHNRGQPERGLEVRVGLHVGEPVADEDDFFGTSVVVAKRLCDQAKGGQILASELVATIVGSRGGFHFRPAGRLALKGLAEPLPAVAVDWQAVGAPPREAPAETPASRAPAPRGPRLVGRERELTLLEAEFERAAGGELSCVLLVGEPGVGKTRLAGELLARHREGVVGLSARAYPLGGTASFGLWAEALERHLRGLPAPEVIRVCGGFLDDLAGLLRSVAAVRGTPQGGEPPGLRLLEGLAVVLSNLAGTATVVVVLDDVHLADASSWEGLRYLAHNLPDARLLVVAAARPAELAEHEVAGRVLFGLEQEGFLTRLDLRPLDAESVAELAQTVLGRAPPPALVAWLDERSRGNPLFALGLIRALQEEEADLSAPRLRRLPEGLADRVGERLKAFDEPTRSILEVLAALGRRVEVGELVGMSGRPLEELGSILERLVQHRFVLEEERGAELIYEIAHPLIAEAVYQAIGRVRRRPLHRLIGRSLLAAGRLGEAAPHFAASADPGDPEAVEALRDALRQAEGRAAYREALTIIGSLVDLLPPGDQRWVEVAEGLAGQAEWVVDHRADVHALLGIRALRAIDAALEGSPDLVRRAAVKLRLGTFLGWGTGELDEAERLCADARELFEAAGHPAEALLTRLELAYLASFKGDLPAWLEGARPVAEEAESIGDRLVTMHAVGRGIGIGAVYVGRFEEAEMALRRGLALAVEDGKPYFQTLCLALLACSLAMTGRIDEALPAMEEAKAVNPDWRDSVLLEYQAIVHWMAGDFGAAVAVAQDSEAWSPGGVSKRRAMAIPFAVLSAVETGQTAEARRHLARAQAAYGERDFLWCRPSCGHAAAVLAWRDAEAAGAVDALRQAATHILAVGARPFAAFAFLDLAEMAAENDRLDVAGEAASRLEELASALDHDLYRGLAALGSAWAVLASGAPGRAEGPARAAVEFLAPTGCRAFSARALDALGRSLSGRDRPGAVSAFEAAAAGFESCGAAWRRDRTLEMLRQLGTRGRRVADAVTGPASLTRRERQVARLAAQGHSVRQIGERLYISGRTVETHLAAVYAKLGVKSKSELVGRTSELDV